MLWSLVVEVTAKMILAGYLLIVVVCRFNFRKTLYLPETIDFSAIYHILHALLAPERVVNKVE